MLVGRPAAPMGSIGYNGPPALAAGADGELTNQYSLIYCGRVTRAITAALPQDGNSPAHFLRLAGHPLRWRLLSELVLSDRRVGDLTRLLNSRQSLVSYHLGRLRKSGAISGRRSSADRRDTYYRIDIARCGELLSASGAALHPALRLIPPPPAPRAIGEVARVLFLCTGNSGRSQMAEALVNERSAGGIEALSAGSHPKPLHPAGVGVMAARGIDISAKRSKHLDEYAGQRFDAVVCLSDRVREICPAFPGHPEPTHWSTADPAREGEGSEETYAAFEHTAQELETRIGFLLHQLGAAIQSADEWSD